MYEVKKISAGILPTNTYVLYDSQTKCCVVVDPAFDGDKITKFIEEKGLKPVAVLLTHGHFDHCGGAKPIVEKYGVPVYGRKGRGSGGKRVQKPLGSILPRLQNDRLC